MSFVSFIGKRFSKVEKKGFSGSVVSIASASIVLSIAVMLVSVIIVRGFQLEIRNKVIGFAGHIVVKPYQLSSLQQQIPINYKREDIIALKENVSNIVHLQPTAEIAGIIKTDDQMEACVLKGVNYMYDRNFILQALEEGSFPVFDNDSVSNEIVISRTTANRLNIVKGDFLRVFFLLPGEVQPRGRRFIVSGIYNTGLFEFDRKYIFGDIQHIQQLNKWEKNSAGIIEVFVDDFNNIDIIHSNAKQFLDYDVEVEKISELYPNIFNWLKLLDMNVRVILTIMLIVALINVITILLIRILEKTSAIGILKALGATNQKIRRIFFYVSMRILLKGVIFGNLLAFTLMLLQKYFSIIKLNQETYFMDKVPVYFDIDLILLVNILVIVCSVLVIIVPSMIISRIYPAKTLRLK